MEYQAVQEVVGGEQVQRLIHLLDNVSLDKGILAVQAALVEDQVVAVVLAAVDKMQVE
jgi:hypothetical protein